jgi:hypothetical protein
MLTKSNVSGFSLVPVLFVLTLFLLLSILAVSVILAGSSVYETISEDMDGNYYRRVSFSYLTTKIRQNDSDGNIYVEEKNGEPMLAVKENYMGEEYVTYIYYHDGWIRELFLDLIDGKTVDFELDWGERIIEAEGFAFFFNGEAGKIEMNLTDAEGNTQSTKVALRSQK